MKKIAVIGGGAAGMTCAVLLARRGYEVALVERGERLGRKLSATGNGQGNLTNLRMGQEHYFTDGRETLARILSDCPPERVVRFFEGMGGAYVADARGRVYPAGRQASALTDLLCRELARLGVAICLGAQVRELAYDGGFSLKWEGGQMRADAVVLAAGGKAAKNFGTDGSAYALAEAFGHTIVPPAPVLVRLRSDPNAVRGLRGIRVDAGLTLLRRNNPVFSCRGDVLFTENGVSGDAVFLASSHAEAGDELRLDLVPDVPAEGVSRALSGGEGEDCLLCLVNNMLGRTIYRMAGGDKGKIAALVKGFPVPVKGTLGFDGAQATRGGIPLAEVDASLMSKFRRDLYFAGEILNVDGECGGYNLHFAFASAHAVSEAIQ